MIFDDYHTKVSAQSHVQNVSHWDQISVQHSYWLENMVIVTYYLAQAFETLRYLSFGFNVAWVSMSGWESRSIAFSWIVLVVYFVSWGSGSLNLVHMASKSDWVVIYHFVSLSASLTIIFPSRVKVLLMCPCFLSVLVLKNSSFLTVVRSSLMNILSLSDVSLAVAPWHL